MRMRALAVLLTICAAPAAADIVCRPEMRCDAMACRATNPADDEAAFYVTDPGGRSQMYVSEGTWAAAPWVQDAGLTVWTAPTPGGGTLRLALRADTGAFLSSRTSPDGRAVHATGRCTTR